jgi:hypothetical protein
MFNNEFSIFLEKKLQFQDIEDKLDNIRQNLIRGLKIIFLFEVLQLH